MAEPPTLEDIQSFSAKLEKRREELKSQIEDYRADKRKLKRMILDFQATQTEAQSVSRKELKALRIIQETGKRDYAVITKTLFGRDTPENRKEAYKTFARWKSDEWVWKEERVWVVEEDIFEEEDEEVAEDD